RTMKKIIVLTVLMAARLPVGFSATSELTAQATFLSSADISTMLKRMPPGASTDQPLRIIDGGAANVGIFVVRRPQEPDEGCTIEKSITYQVVRIDSGKVLPLKSPSAAQPRGISPFACDRLALSPEIQKRHFDVVGPELLKLRKSVRELEDGYDFEFPVDEKTFQLLSEWAMQERLCCPFLDISLRFEREGGSLWLRLAGRKGVKEFIKIEMTQGGIKP